MTATLAPSLKDLRSMLERAERQVVADDHIDNFARRQRELARSRAQVAAIEAQIARIEESL